MAKQFINIGTGEQEYSWDITTDSTKGTIEFTELGGNIKLFDASHIGFTVDTEADKVVINTEIGRYEFNGDNINEIDGAEPVSTQDIYDKIKDGLYGA